MAYSFPRGASLLLGWIILSGDVTGVAAVTAALRPALATDPTRVDPTQGAVASFTTAYTAAAGGVPAFYSIALAASASATLAIGNYLVDLRFTYSDGSVQFGGGAPLPITITEPATTA